MSNKEHSFQLILKVDDKMVATRQATVTEFNDNIIYSLRLNQLMKDMCGLIEAALRERSIEKVFEYRESGF